MKQLHEYDTPETDIFSDIWDYYNDPQEAVDYASNLEQRLAACRDALTLVIQRGEGMQNSDQYLYEVLHTCRRTLTLTAAK
jgi:hypothetical protein